MKDKKYRAWDGTQMYYATFDDLLMAMGSQGAGDWSLEEQVGEELARFQGSHLPVNQEMIYMEGIDRPDKTGKQIYEDDIIIAEWHWTEPHRVTWPDDYYWLQEVSLDSENLEVIGNVWEHPHLLPS